MLFRRWLVALVGMLLLSGLLWMPAARAQSGGLFFPATGHNVSDATGFLSFWQQHNGSQVLGAPVSEALADGDQTVQYFEGGVLQRGSAPDAVVQTGMIGVDYAKLMYRTFPVVSARTGGSGVQFFEVTGHTLREPVLGFWQKNGGDAFFGAPISEVLWETTARGQRRVQYFERGRLEIAGANQVVVGALGRQMALLRGVSIAPVANTSAEIYGPPAAQDPQVTWLDQPPPPTATPQPTARPAATAQPAATTRPAARPAPQPAPQPTAQPRSSRGTAAVSVGKSIVVNLSKQWLYAFEDGQQVFSAPVSTGRDGMETPPGNFSIYSKLRSQTMDGTLDGKYWIVPNVPNVMYINGGVALHGTYWHNLFGTGARPSHGCVNMPLQAAAWLYDWAPTGTPVRVTY